MIAVSGSDGFIGTHCKFFCKMQNIKNVVFLQKKDFQNRRLKKKIKNCTSFIHLAGINKESQGDITKINLDITKKIISSLKNNKKIKNFIFASSLKRFEKSNYGKSKKLCEKEIIKFTKNRIKFTNLILPNVFGEFCKPNYNSVVSTFCYNLINNKNIKIIENKKLKLIYVGNVVKQIFDFIINNKKIIFKKDIINISIKDIKNKLINFKEEFNKNITPNFSNDFELNLFNTLKSFSFPKKNIFSLKKKIDKRGHLIELLKAKSQAHFFSSITKKNITRGNHYHSKKIEKFIVIEGKAIIKFRKITEKKIYSMIVNGNRPVCIDIPNFFTHNIKNIGDSDLLTLFFSNELYNPKLSDTFFDKV
jgi:UDP-2-acetamido-2,6-beta-L-arabino-hexul-4-ose reductase